MHHRMIPAWLLAAFFPFLVSGCSSSPSPSFPLFGAYFPSWLLCIAGGIIGALVTRVIFVRIGIDDQLPFRLLVYISVAAGIAFAMAIFIYGQ